MIYINTLKVTMVKLASHAAAAAPASAELSGGVERVLLAYRASEQETAPFPWYVRRVFSVTL